MRRKPEPSIADCLGTLGLMHPRFEGSTREQRNASMQAWKDTVLKSTWRKLCMEYHPDRNPGDEKAAARFHGVQVAYKRVRTGLVARQAARPPPAPKTITVCPKGHVRQTISMIHRNKGSFGTGEVTIDPKPVAYCPWCGFDYVTAERMSQSRSRFAGRMGTDDVFEAFRRATEAHGTPNAADMRDAFDDVLRAAGEKPRE